MAPDVDELIKRINTLTLDKNRLKQKLTQLTNDHNGKDAISKLNQMSIKQQGSRESTESFANDTTTSQSSNSISNLLNSNPSSKQSTANNQQSSPLTTTASAKSSTPPKQSNVIAGIECATSCEDDILFMNELYRKRLDEYEENWDHVQSKCSALLSELNALQVHYGRLKREKLELEEKYLKKCDECKDIKSELQTVVLNYETQLSTMSEHLSSITRKMG